MIGLQKEMHARYDVTTTIRHRGEKGRNREHGLAMFLRENLPERYGVATGEIIPHLGDEVSPQCDIIIYDRMMFPILGKYSSVQQIPIEAVYSVIEVKSQIDRQALRDATRKFGRIRAMPKCPPRRNPRRGAESDPIFLLFGYKLKTTEKACVDFILTGEGTDTSIVALDTGCTIWVEVSKNDVRPIFLRGSDTDSGANETLGLSFAALLEDLGSIDLGTPSYFQMMTW